MAHDELHRNCGIHFGNLSDMPPTNRVGHGILQTSIGSITGTGTSDEGPTPPAGAEEPSSISSTTTKRRLSQNNESDKFTRRKRARLACHFCRLRKAKCDNKRPTCSFCAHHEARCVYADQAELDDTVDVPEAGFNGEGLTAAAILNRLDEIKGILTQHTQHQVDSPSNSISTNTIPAISAASVPSPGGSRCEALLTWPIFDSAVPAEDRSIDSLPLLFAASDDYATAAPASLHRPLSATNPLNSPSLARGRTGSIGHRQASLGFGVQEAALLPLCQKFLREVHSRNPILDAAELISSARDAAENGLLWDARACLVLIACALALSQGPSSLSAEVDSDADALSMEAEADANARAGAEAYYLAARKRIGLLGTSIVDIQCLFFASIYERYALRILPAWLLIQQACSRLQMLIQARGGAHAWGGRPDPTNAVSDYPTMISAF